jgi:hypothetical protein
MQIIMQIIDAEPGQFTNSKCQTQPQTIQQQQHIQIAWSCNIVVNTSFDNHSLAYCIIDKISPSGILKAL